MKKLFTLVAVAFMAISANAQAVIAEIDWTQQESYGGGLGSDLWFPSGTGKGQATVSVEPGTGLIIEAVEGDNYWEPQVPMIGHIMSQPDPEDLDQWGNPKWHGEFLTEGGNYQVIFTCVSPMAGELRLDFCSWDGTGATSAQVFDIVEGENEITRDFKDYPTECEDAMIFYQCGHLPGKHIIKKVTVIDLDADATGIKTLKNKVQSNVRYNLAGQKVDANYKGAVIMNGKKFIQK